MVNVSSVGPLISANVSPCSSPRPCWVKGGQGTTDRPRKDGLSEGRSLSTAQPGRVTSPHQAGSAPPGVDNSPCSALPGTTAHSWWLQSPQPQWAVQCTWRRKETDNGRWFPWCYRLGRVQRSSGIWTHIRSFQVLVGCRANLLLCSSVGKPMVRSLVEAGCSDLCSQLQPDSLPRPTCSSLQLPDHFSSPARSRISLSPSILFPGLNTFHSKAHSLRCRFNLGYWRSAV